jgi:hypothetical protein
MIGGPHAGRLPVEPAFSYPDAEEAYAAFGFGRCPLRVRDDPGVHISADSTILAAAATSAVKVLRHVLWTAEEVREAHGAVAISDGEDLIALLEDQDAPR